MEQSGSTPLAQTNEEGKPAQANKEEKPKKAPLSPAASEGTGKGEHEWHGDGRGRKFTRWVLNLGFLVALLMAGYCLWTSVTYMGHFQTGMQGSIDAILPPRDTTTAHMLTPAQPTQNLLQQGQIVELALAGQMYLARIQLLSCGIFVAMAFGFLGFSLFLIGIEGQMDATASNGSLSLNVLKISPGVFVLLCSTILIGVCATRTLPLDIVPNTTNHTTPPKGEPLKKKTTTSPTSPHGST